MNDKLIEIAKANGGKRWNGNDDRDLPSIILTDDQLRTTVEQVCRPLVEALQRAERLHLLSDEFIGWQIFSKRTALLGLRKSLATYTEVMGVNDAIPTNE